MMRWLCVVCILFALSSCGNPFDEARRGGGTEIPNGVAVDVCVRLTDSAGVPMARTSLQVVAGESWATRVQSGKTVVLDSVTTDSLGMAVIPVSESRVFLLARNHGQGIFMPLTPNDSAGNSSGNPLPIPARRLARLNLSTQNPGQLAIFGTPWRGVAPISNGLLHLDSVPQGDYLPIVVDSLGLSMGQTVAAQSFDTVVDVVAMVFSDPENLMVENFQNRRLLAIWDPVHVGGYWWATARVNDVASWDYFGMTTLTDMLDSLDGNIYAGVTVDFPDTGVAVANFGLDFSTDPVNTNLSHASAISFAARGQGTWVVYVQTQDSLGFNVLRWTHTISIDSTWHTFHLPLDSFHCEGNSSILWSQATRLGTNLFWQTNGDGTLQVDDIVFEGFRFEDWIDP